MCKIETESKSCARKQIMCKIETENKSESENKSCAKLNGKINHVQN